MEDPHHLARRHVVGANITRRRQISFANRRSQRDQILEDAPGRLGLYARNRRGIAAESLPQIDQPVVPEREN